jgi:hypothetical protein
MPGVYKLKVCPECKKEHRKRGPFCSQACSNSHREVSDKVHDHAKQMGENNAGDPAQIANGHLVKQGLITKSEDFAINIPDIPDLPEGYDSAENW